MKSPRLPVLFLAAAACLSLVGPLAAADAPDPAVQAKLAVKITEIQALAADPVIVNAVVAQNAHASAEVAEMTQEKWKALSVLDPAVRAFAKNEAGVFLKNHKPAWISEAFLNDAHGLKVALLNKTTNWSHAASAKHTGPMAGKTWQGPVEVDESSGVQQVQISVPVLHDGSPVGSLVIGVALSKLD